MAHRDLRPALTRSAGRETRIADTVAELLDRAIRADALAGFWHPVARPAKAALEGGSDVAYA